MARTDTLTHFLTDVADAIRTKTGSSAAISAANFDTEIESIPSGSGHDWSTIGFEQEPTGSRAAYQRAVALKNNWDPNTTTMPTNKFQQSDLVYMPDIDMRGITTTDAFKNCFQCLGYVTYSSFNLPYSKSALTAVAKIKAKPYGSISEMFSSCRRLTELDLSGIDTSEVTNMYGAFSKISVSENPNPITTLDLSNFNTAKVTDFRSMFSGNDALQSLNLSSFTISSGYLIRTASMFGNCTSLTHIDIRSMTLSNITGGTAYYENMFGTDAANGVPDDCEIIVMNDTQKTWITSKWSRFTNVKTAAEYEAEQNA